MNIKSFDEIINNILSQEKIENVPLKNCNLIKQVIFDDKLHNTFYKKFESSFNSCVEDDSLINTKINDFVYRVNIFINNYLIDKCNIDDKQLMVIETHKYLNDNFDFYSAVDYSDFDIEEIVSEATYINKDIKI